MKMETRCRYQHSGVSQHEVLKTSLLFEQPDYLKVDL